jgi:regulator of sigma E protease
MLTVVAFIVALGLLIAVHEYGHYRVAVACGVKVLCFSVGFGKTLYRWQPKNQKNGQSTEFVIGMFPLGGYVKMLDEREAPVPEAERHLAFNTQPLRSRAAIVAAGPAANLLLAVLLYALVNWYGVQEPRPVLASPVAASVAEAAGLRGGDVVQSAGFAGDELEPIESFEQLRWLLTRGALDGRDLRMEVARIQGGATREVTLGLSSLETRDADAKLFRRIGILGPWTQPVIGDVVPGGAAEKSGLLKGDVVLMAGDVPVVDGSQLRELIRGSVLAGKGRSSAWRVEREGRTVALEVTPDVRQDNGLAVGRIGAYVGAPPEFVTVRHGPIDRPVEGCGAHLGGVSADAAHDGQDGDWRGVAQEPQRAAHDCRLRGQVCQHGPDAVPGVSGPDQRQPGRAEPAAAAGPRRRAPDVLSLGGRDGKSVSDAWMERLQRGAWRALVMMSIALFNDVTRLFG